MTKKQLLAAVRTIATKNLPLPGGGQTILRHRCLMEIGRDDLSLARLAEAHWDAVAILTEAGREARAGTLYGVWASEKPGQPLRLDTEGLSMTISGVKPFCSGAGLIDRALLTVRVPDELLLDVDLKRNSGLVEFDDSGWKTHAFAETGTATATFRGASVSTDEIVGEPGWYLARPGFWHGACGPAACWAGGAAGLVDFAVQQSREDSHTLAHLGAMHASIWAMRSYLDSAAHEIDSASTNALEARIRALTIRHLIEQECTGVLRRLARAYGPYPLAMDADIARRYQELDLYLRQSHAERDLEALGRDARHHCATTNR